MAPRLGHFATPQSTVQPEILSRRSRQEIQESAERIIGRMSKALSSVQRTNGLPMNGYSLINFSWLPIDAIGCAKSDLLMLGGASVELLNAVNIWFFIVPPILSGSHALRGNQNVPRCGHACRSAAKPDIPTQRVGTRKSQRMALRVSALRPFFKQAIVEAECFCIGFEL